MVSVYRPARGGRSCERFGGYKTLNRIPLPLYLVLSMQKGGKSIQGFEAAWCDLCVMLHMAKHILQQNMRFWTFVRFYSILLKRFPMLTPCDASG